MNCQKVRERLPGLIDGELAAGEAAEVEKHLEGCSDCREEKHRQEQFTTSVKSSLEGLRPSEFFVKGVLEQIETPRKTGDAAARRTRVSLIAAGAVIAAVLLAMWIHAAAARGGAAATVTGYEEAWLLVEKADGGELKKELPLRVPAGSRIKTEAGGKVIMELTGGGGLTLHEKSRVVLRARGLLLESGAVTATGGPGGGFVAAGDLGAQVNPRGRALISLQYGDTLAVEVEEGTVEILGAEKHRGWTGRQKCSAGEVWKAPANSSGAPEKVR